MLRIYGLLALLSVFSNFIHAQYDDKYYRVEGTISIQKRQDLEGSRYPWIKEEYLGRAHDRSDIKCSFYDIEYVRENYVEDEKIIKVRAQPEEFCSIRGYMTRRPTLVKVRIWNEVEYLVEFVYTDYDHESKREYVSLFDLKKENIPDLLPLAEFVDFSDLDSNPEKSKQDDRWNHCEHTKRLSANQISAMEKSEYVIKFGDYYCKNSLIWLDDIPIEP